MSMKIFSAFRKVGFNKYEAEAIRIFLNENLGISLNATYNSREEVREEIITTILQVGGWEKDHPDFENYSLRQLGEVLIGKIIREEEANENAEDADWEDFLEG